MWRVALSLLAFLVLTASSGRPAQAQAGPRFTLGFGALASLIPDLAGLPLENERFDPRTGDAVQRTTRGLMVWRKADNVTAFTDGSTTWLLGPLGLQSRSNAVPFDWERSGSPSPVSANAVTLAFSRDNGGPWVGQGTIRNPTADPVDAEVNVVAYSGPNGVPVMDAPTIYIEDLAPGETRPLAVRVPFSAPVADWRSFVSSTPATVEAHLEMDVGTTSDLIVDPELAGAVEALRSVDDGEWLVRVAAENGVVVVSAPTGRGVLGNFEPVANVVAISSRLESSSAWVRATVLAHELQHAAGAAAGKLPETSGQCFQFEAEAFQRQSVVWSELWQSDLPADVDVLHSELNDVATTVAHDPEGFVVQLINRYRAECGTLPERAPLRPAPGP